jgi:hypothetical protein
VILLIPAFFIISFILFVIRPPFVWMGTKRKVHQKVKSMTWIFHPVNSGVAYSSDNRFKISRRTNYGVVGSKFTYDTLFFVNNEKLLEFLVEYQSSSNPITILSCGLCNPLSKIMNEKEIQIQKYEKREDRIKQVLSLTPKEKTQTKMNKVFKK